MLLTSIPMNHPLFREARWGDAAWLHRRTMRAFGDIDATEAGGPRASAGILFRVEPRVAGGRVLVQSKVEPTVDGVSCRDMSVVFDRLDESDRVRFILEFNAAKTVNVSGRRARKALDRAELEPWVRGRLAGAVEVDSIDVLSFQSRRARGANLFVARISGVGRVCDVEALRALVASGVGKGRSYGCGMLTVIPA